MGYLIDTAVLILLALFAYRVTRAHKMASSISLAVRRAWAVRLAGQIAIEQVSPSPSGMIV